MKTILKYLFNTLLTLCLFFVISCSDTVNSNTDTEDLDQGITSVKMFVPDYYLIAEQESNRAIAPQTASARLCYLVNGNWVGINTVNLDTATKTPVTNAPQGFSGSMYTFSFSGVPLGSYAAGNLKIELRDSSDSVITSGTNATAVTITKDSPASTTFYTVPETSGANAGNLNSGEMKFSRAALVEGVTYNIVLTSSGDYPDLVLFGSDGKITKYYAVDSQNQASIALTVDSTDVYFLGLWADDGNDIARYTLNFDFGQGTQINGVLTGANLHWTKENNPYIVNGNLLVEEGSELSIDEGVIVQFTGNYYLKVTGTISALGSKEDPIIFVQSGDNLNTWAGIIIDSSTSLNLENTYNYVSGNRLSNCMVIGADTPLKLNSATYVDSCTFTGNSEQLSINSSSIVINNIIDNGLYSNNGSIIINNIIKRYIFAAGYSSFINNTITNAPISLYDTFFDSNTITSCSIQFNCYYTPCLTYNTFSGYNDIILNTSDCPYANRKSFNFTGNYWGQVQTAEIESKLGSNVPDDEKDYNMSFFTDYYDNFEYTKIDFSNWATEPIEGTGYLGDGFIAFDYTINGYNFSNSGYYPESTSPELNIVVNPKYHANSISGIRIAQSLSQLKETSWETYTASQTFTANLNNLIDGLATIYVQLKDSKGNISSPVMHEVPFDKPLVTLSIADGTEYSNATSSVTLNYGATDKGNLTQYELYIDDRKVSSYESSSGWGKNYSNSYSIALAYMPSGNHKVKLNFWDSARNLDSKEITFKINHNVDTSIYSGTSYDISTGQLLKDQNTLYLWHLDSNGNEVSEESSLVLSNYSAVTGGLGGYSKGISTSNTIPLELDNAFTIELWRKGDGSPSISKSNVFSISYSYFYRYYLTASGSINNDYTTYSYVTDSNWHYWSYVYGGTYLAIYCDGILISYRDGLTQSLNTNDNKLYISISDNLDELRISNIARSPDEIAAYYNAAKSLIVE